MFVYVHLGLPGCTLVKNMPAYRRCRGHRFDPWVRKISWGRKWQCTPVFLPGKFQGQRNLWALVHGVTKALDTAERLGTTTAIYTFSSVQFSSVAQSCHTLCDPMNCSTPGLPVHHQLLEFTQTHVHRVGVAIQPSHPLLSLSPPAPNTSQHQSLFQWVNSLHEVAKVLEFQL